MEHQRQLEEARFSSQSAIKEREQMQNDKRKMLMETETQKLKELDEEYAKDLREWKAHLKPRKQVKIVKYVPKTNTNILYLYFMLKQIL